MRSFLLVCLFSMLACSASGQRLIKASVLDAETQQAIPYASIGIVGTSKGTSTNVNGEFQIQLPEQASLQISSIGYESLILRDIPSSGKIFLQPRTTNLDPVLVSSRPINPYKIVRKAFAGQARHYYADGFLQTFFYRHYCKDGDTHGRLIEAFFDVWRPKGYRTSVSGPDTHPIRVTQLRRSLDRTVVAQGHEPISITSILEADPVGYQSDEKSILPFSNISNLKSNLSAYELTFEGVTSYDGLEVYRIGFQSKKDSVLLSSGSFQHTPAIEGTLYITVDSETIIRFDQTKTFQHNQVRTAVYYRRYEDKFYPYHFFVDGKTLAPGIDSHAYHIELMSVDIDKGPDKKFQGKVPGAAELLQVPYDSAFWERVTTLRTTPLEDQIIKDLGGGQSLHRQFSRYRQFQYAIRDGGVDAVEKINWLLRDSKQERFLYVMFWSENYQPYWFDLEYIKQSHKHLRKDLMVLLISLDDNQSRWSNAVQKHNLFSDGIVNYRIGPQSSIHSQFPFSQTPAFFIVNKEGAIEPARRPSDPSFKSTLESLLRE